MKRYSLAIAILLCAAGAASQTNTEIAQNSITVPAPLTVGIDDVGWKRGWSTDANGGPWRLGLPEGRWMVLEDYEAVADVGKKVGTRFLCLFVMCEFDRGNICASYPTTTQGGKLWDNSALTNDGDFVIMNYIKDHAAYIEFGLHGVAHDYWENGVKSKGEFASCNYKKGHRVRPYSEMQGHLECFKKLIDQYGVSFPKSFVAPHYCYYYNPTDQNDTGGLMSRWGIKYGSQSRKTYLTDNGLMVLPRTTAAGDGDKWNATSFVPSKIPDANYCYVESHWANFVETNPANNHLAAEKWIEWFNGIKKMPDRYVPKNTAQLFSQYLYKKYSKFKIDANSVTIDNSGMPDWVYDGDFLGNLVLKVSLKPGEHVSSAELNGHDIACYYEDAGYGYIVLWKLGTWSQSKFVYSTGDSEMPNYVENEGTYNVINFAVEKDEATISLEMYGTQDVTVKLGDFAFAEAKSSTKNLKINSSKWDKSGHTLVLNVTASDAQGVEGSITITGKQERRTSGRHRETTGADSNEGNDMAGAKYFPDNIFSEEEDLNQSRVKGYSSYLKALEEPSIYNLKGEKDKRIYRFLWLRTFDRPIAVRIQILEDGSGTLTAKMTDGAGGYEPGKIVKNVNKKMKREDIDRFLMIIEKEKFWESASIVEDTGVDGAQWIIEGLDSGNYHLVKRWSPRSGGVKKIGLFLLKSAGFKGEEIY